MALAYTFTKFYASIHNQCYPKLSWLLATARPRSSRKALRTLTRPLGLQYQIQDCKIITTHTYSVLTAPYVELLSRKSTQMAVKGLDGILGPSEDVDLLIGMIPIDSYSI